MERLAGRRSGGRREPAVRSQRRALEQPRRVVLEEHARDELAAGAHADLLEDRLEMILDRPRRDVQAIGDRARSKSLGDELRDAALAVGEPVGVRDQGRELVRPGGLERSPPSARRRRPERRAAHDQPDAGRGADTRARAMRPPRAAVPDAARPARHGGDHRREAARPAAAPNSASQVGGGVGLRDRVVGREQARPACPTSRRPLAGQRGEQHRPPQSLGEVARHRRDERYVGRRERASVGAAQQRQAAPGRRVTDQRGPQLVTEPVGPPELAMAQAPVELARS